MLKHTRTKSEPAVSRTKAIVVENDYGRMERREVVVDSPTRGPSSIVGEVPVCRECYSGLQLGASEDKIRRYQRLQGRVPNNKRVVAYDGLKMFFGEEAIRKGGGEANWQAHSIFIAKPAKVVHLG